MNHFFESWIIYLITKWFFQIFLVFGLGLVAVHAGVTSYGFGKYKDKNIFKLKHFVKMPKFWNFQKLANANFGGYGGTFNSGHGGGFNTYGFIFMCTFYFQTETHFFFVFCIILGTNVYYGAGVGGGYGNFFM